MKLKIHCQHRNCGGHKLLAIFDLQVTFGSLTKFQVNWPFGSGEERENLFSRWPPFFFIPVPSMRPTQVRANWPFHSEEVRNRFSRWPPWPLPCISDWKDFILFFFYYLFFLERFYLYVFIIYLFFFFIYKSPLCFLPSFKSLGLSVQEKKPKTDFQDAAILYFR